MMMIGSTFVMSFQVAGTIITYELVLIQFDQDEETANDDLCVGIRGVGN